MKALLDFLVGVPLPVLAVVAIGIVAACYAILDRWSAACERSEASIEWRDYE